MRAAYLSLVRNRLLVLAALAAMVPALAVTWGRYDEQQAALEASATATLAARASDAARELAAWLNQRESELRVGAGSYVVSENISIILRGRDARMAAGRLRDYLNALRDRYNGYAGVMVTDTLGRLVVASAGRMGRVPIPADALRGLRTGDVYVGDAFWDTTLETAAMVVAVPIREPNGRFRGVLAGKLNLRVLGETLQALAAGPGELYLATDDGRMLLRGGSSSAELMETSVPDTTMRPLLDGEGRPVVSDMAAVLRRAPQLGWVAVAEVPVEDLTQATAQLGRDTALLVFALLAGVLVMAGVVGFAVLRPVERLTTTATRVASGDLMVDLPPGGIGTVGHLTRAFNTMVGRLREKESQGELERLSVTDPLTGLYNRRFLMGALTNEAQRSRRLRRPFSVLLLDVDHFKKYNDTQGHAAGDAVLTRLAEILRRSTRGVDSVARYGGEEFVVMLLETTVATAALVAERMRARVAAESPGTVPGGGITVSIGVAECPAHGDTPEELLATADAAMYQAKAEGRDRVVVSGGGPIEKRRRKRKEPQPGH